MKQLAKAVCDVMAEVKRLEKGDDNKFANYKYTSIDDIKDDIRPLLAKHGLALHTDEVGFETFEMTDDKGKTRLIARYRFLYQLFHTSGEVGYTEHSTVTLPYVGAQTTGQARSYGIKEWMKGSFLVSTGEQNYDADATEQREYASKSNGSKATYPKSNSRPIFARLDQDQFKITELDKLSEWRGKTTAEREKLDHDFKIDLDFNYVAHGMSIAESMAALSAFYKDAYKNIMPGMPMDKQEDLTAMKNAAKEQLAKIETLAAG